MKKKLLPLACASLLLSACTNHHPVPSTECPKLVKQSQKILGQLARPTNEMMAECKKLTDEQRGCVKEAKIVHDLVSCKD